MKDGVSTTRAQCYRRRSTPSRRVEDVPASHQDSKNGRRTMIHLWFTLGPVHKVQHLAVTLSRDKPSTNTLKVLLKG